MPKVHAIQVWRGLNANRTAQTPLEGELMYTTDTKEVYVGDGTTAGGKLVGGTGGDPNFVSQSSPGIAPTATGTDAIAIGDNAISGNAAGDLSTIAIGARSSALGVNAIAIGEHTDADGANSIAIGGASIETSSADAIGIYSIAIGANSYANISGTAIGTSATAGIEKTIALGNNATADTYGAIAIGYQTNATTGVDTIAIGRRVDSTGANSIAIGGHATDASSADASGSGAVAVGILSNAATSQSVAVGQQAQAVYGVSTIAVGYQASATGTAAISIGQQAIASTGTDPIAIGRNADATGTGSIAIGGHTTDTSSADASGVSGISIGIISNAVADQGIAIGEGAQAGDAAGDYSAIALGTNSSSIHRAAISMGDSALASNTNSMSLGKNTSATGVCAIAIGGDDTASLAAIASSTFTIAIGHNTTASGFASASIGVSTEATATNSFALGANSKASLVGQHARASGFFSVEGDSQLSRFVCRGATTNATVTNINPDGGTVNRMIVPINTLWGFRIQLTVREQATGDSKYLEFTGALKRNGTTTTALVGTVTTLNTVNDAGATWTAAVTANDTDEALQIAVTGEALHNLHWVAVVHISSVSD